MTAPPPDASLLRAILEAMAEGVVVFDAEGRPILVNGALARMTGVSREGLPSAIPTLRTLVVRADGTPFDAHDMPFARALRGESIDQEILRVPSSPGRPSESWLSISARPIQIGRASCRERVYVLV